MLRNLNLYALALTTVCLVLPILMLTGCGAKTPYPIVPLEGTASYKGKPLERVILTFGSGDKRESSAVVLTGGKFKAIHTPQLDGVPTGKCIVRVGMDSAAIGAAAPEEYKELFEKYGMNSKGLEIDVTKADKNFNLNFE